MEVPHEALENARPVVVLEGRASPTLRAGVSVPSTSNRHTVFFTGRSWSAGMMAAATAIALDSWRLCYGNRYKNFGRL